MKPVLPETRSLRAVVVLAEELNFTRASSRLHISQSGLSRRIGEIENRLGLKLFLRDRTQVRLSPSGEAFVPEAKAALLHVEKAVRAAESTLTSRTTLRIGRSPYTNPILTEALLSTTLARYPKMQVKLHSEFAGDLVEQVLSSKLDMALIANPRRTRGLTSVIVERTALCAVLPRRHRLARRIGLSFGDLGRLSWVVFDRKTNVRLHDSLMERAKKEAVQVNEFHTVLSVDEALQLVRKGAGIAFIAQSAVENHLPSGLISIPISDQPLFIDTHLVSRSDDTSKLTSVFARAYVHHIREGRRSRGDIGDESALRCSEARPRPTLQWRPVRWK